MSFFIPSAFGLDISERSIKIAALKKARSGFEFASWVNKEIPAGMIERGEIKEVEKVAEYLGQAFREAQGYKIRTPYAAVSLPEEKTFLKVIQMPRMQEKELYQAVLFEAESHIPLAPEEAVIDFQIVPPLTGSLDHYDILLAAIPRGVVEGYAAVCKEAGFIPVILEPESIAIAHALIERGVSKEPVLLIDVGASRTTFIVFSGYSVRFTSSIPVSSEILTETIASSLGLSLEEAEKLKVIHGIDKKAEGGKLYEAIRPLLEELVEHLEKQFSFYQTHARHEHLNGKQRVSRVFLSGGGALLGGLTFFLAESLKTDVDVGNPFVNVFSKSQGKVPTLPFQKSLAYTTAIGLALAGQEFFLW